MLITDLFRLIPQLEYIPAALQLPNLCCSFYVSPNSTNNPTSPCIHRCHSPLETIVIPSRGYALYFIMIMVVQSWADGNRLPSLSHPVLETMYSIELVIHSCNVVMYEYQQYFPWNDGMEFSIETRSRTKPWFVLRNPPCLPSPVVPESPPLLSLPSSRAASHLCSMYVIASIRTTGLERNP